jgi:hypothetical protein
MRKFAIDVVVAIPAVMTAALIMFAVMDGPLIHALYRDGKAKREGKPL